MTKPAGWTTTGTSTNLTGGHSGRWLWQLSAQSSIEQAVANLPDGTYSLSAWVKGTGGQSVAQIYAKNFGGTEKDSALNTALGSWTQKT